MRCLNTLEKAPGLLLLAGFLACIAIIVALFARMIGTDQAYLMLIAQEFVLGRAQYTQIYDMQPPASVYLHVPPILAFQLFKLPMMTAWNAYMIGWCGLSGYLFASLVETRRRMELGLLWFAITLLGFDDYDLGQRDFFFSLAWFPYVAGRLLPSKYRLSIPLVGSGLLLSIIVCAKPTLAAFVLLIDIPLLLVRRFRQSFVPLLSLLFGGALQVLHFLLFEPLDAFFALPGKIRYYETIGMNYQAVFDLLINTYSLYVVFIILGIIYVFNKISHRDNSYATACAATAAVAIGFEILQGHPRPYYLIPALISPVAASLYSAFSDDETSTLLKYSVVTRIVAVVTCLAAVLQLGATEGGMMRAFARRYLWDQAEYARIGKMPADEYMVWVQRNVAPKEEIAVIALDYGHTSEFDPVLSTLRLGRRANSHAPILQFPLRAALVSGNDKLIDAAWDTLIEEITSTSAEWIIVRRPTPAPLEADFLDIIAKNPRFARWLRANFERWASFGSYVAYRRLATAQR